MMNFARALGMGGKGSQQQQPAQPPPQDLPNPPPNANAADTNSVFYIDDSLSELARVKRYSLSQLPLQRLVYVKRVSACARSVGLRDTLRELLPLFAKLVADQEAVVRTAAAGELANLAQFLADPHLPFTPSTTASAAPATAAGAAQLNQGSKPPPTAQSPDPTLEDEVILDLDVPSDVDNTLPASMMGEPGADAAGGATKAAEADSTQDGTEDASEASVAMDVDSSSAPGPSASPKPDSSEAATVADDDSDSTPMDVSSDESAASPPQEEQQEPEQTGETSPEAPSADKQTQDAAESSAATAAASAAAPSPSSPHSTPASAAAATPSPSSPPHAAQSVVAPSPAAVPVPSSPPSSPLRPPSPSDSSDPTSALRLESYDAIRDTVIPCLHTLVVDNNAEVRAAACDALVRVADVLRGDDVGKVVLTLVLNLAHDERDEQRTTAVHLMHELAPRLGHDLCRSFVALELAAFADDSTFRVRKATAQSFGNVCEMVGSHFSVTKLLPCFVRLSSDIIWGVRASAAKSLVAVTRVVPAEVRREVLVPMFERFAKDSSRWVRNGAYEILGPFLHALGPELASKELVAYFANIPSMSSAIVDAEICFHAAFNLPAVVQTIGRERWDELSACFGALVKSQTFPVRRTLAYSLHELAALLGPALTEQSLLPALDAFLRDLDEVRYGVLKNFAAILACMTPSRRAGYLEVLWLIQKQAENWRWRLLWAKQIGAFAKLFSAEHTVSDIMPLALALCRDNVAVVRRTAAKGLGRVVRRFLTFPTPNRVVAPFLSEIRSFASSRTYQERQLFLRMLEGFVDLPGLPAQTVESLVALALPLATDKTSNVRLSCVHLLRVIMVHSSTKSGASRSEADGSAPYRLTESPAAQELARVLSTDSHREVQRQLAAAMQQATTALAATMADLSIAKAEVAAAAESLAAASAAAATPAAVTPAAAAEAATPQNSDELTDADLQDILGSSASDQAAPAEASVAAPATVAAEAPAPASADAVSNADSNSPSSSSTAPSSTAVDVDVAAAASSDDGNNDVAPDSPSSPVSSSDPSSPLAAEETEASPADEQIAQ